MRNLDSAGLYEAIIADLRGYQTLLDRLDVDAVDDTVQQIYPIQALQDVDFPVGLAVRLIPGAGENMNSAMTGDFLVDAICVARLEWRQDVDTDATRGLSSTEMERVLDAAEHRASVAFGIDYLGFNGRTGGASGVGGAVGTAVEEGGQWSSVRRWSITRRVIGEDGPRS